MDEDQSNLFWNKSKNPGQKFLSTTIKKDSTKKNRKSKNLNLKYFSNRVPRDFHFPNRIHTVGLKFVCNRKYFRWRFWHATLDFLERRKRRMIEPSSWFWSFYHIYGKIHSIKHFACERDFMSIKSNSSSIFRAI